MDLSLDELLDVKVAVASNLNRELQKQPSSITLVSSGDIKRSGARTLNELLTLTVPGFFMVHDQDDIIAGFRGLIPDNNSKVMLLLNGTNINTEWFWGPSDAILNGIDLNFIERIEVVRGPGSVTLGQGALLGVINIITREEASGARTAFSVGERHLDTSYFSTRVSNEDVSLSLYYSVGSYDGDSIQNRGWHSNRSDQGLTIYERQHRINRSEFTNTVGNVRLDKFHVEFFRFHNQRDLFNFYRDREVVEQRLDGINLHYESDFTDNYKIKLSTKYLADEYVLASHGGNFPNSSRTRFESQDSVFSSIANQLGLADSRVSEGLPMGGTREDRKGIKATFTSHFSESAFQFAAGFEWNEFNMGRNNRFGHNYIINEEIQLLGIQANQFGQLEVGVPLNEANTWVKPGSFEIKSLFFESTWDHAIPVQSFIAFRWDDHPNWGNQISPRIGSLWKIDTNNQLRVSWQQGFRGAVGLQYSGGFVQDGFLAEENYSFINAIADTVVDFDFDGDGTNDTGELLPVKPETISSFEIEHQYSSNSLSVSTVLFWNLLEDIIAAQAHSYDGLNYGDAIGTDIIGTWGGNWYYQNQQGQLRQFGLEVDARYRWQNGFFRLSHAYVGIDDIDSSATGIYTVGDQHYAAYPENVTRLTLQQTYGMPIGQAIVRLTHLNYWGFYSPEDRKVEGADINNLHLELLPTAYPNTSWQIEIKNVTNQNNLYPINGTGNLSGAVGTASIESRQMELTFEYQF